MGEPLTVERQGSVAVITIDRPQRRNALDGPTVSLLLGAMRTVESDDEIRVAILTGAGGHFCSGMDLKAFAAGEVTIEQERQFADIVEVPLGKPLIAAVEGAAIGGGWELALACDMVVAAHDARFALPEARRGIVAMGGGPLRLPRRIPYHLAMELVLTGGMLDARRAAQFGVVNRLAEPGEALAGAFALAEEVVVSAPLATAAIIELMRGAGDADLDWQRLRDLGQVPYRSQDAREGAQAFAERRAPRWRGL